MITIIRENRAGEFADARVVDGDLWVPDGQYERIAGAPARPGAHVRGEPVNVAAAWRDAGRPAVSNHAGDVWVLGASAGERAAALASLEAPDFTLPDLDGNAHSLSGYRGKKVFLASWASW